MPVLSRITNIFDESWGKGVERLGFVEKHYYPAGVLEALPQKITLNHVQENIHILPILRTVARKALLNTITPDITNRDEAKNIVKKLHESPITSVGDIVTEQTDNERTTNYVIPLYTEKGIIEIVVSMAWGVSWRLHKDHESVKNNKSLAECQPADMSDEAGKTNTNTYYLSPDVLSQAIQDNINPMYLAERIKTFVIGLLSNSNKKYEYDNSLRNLPENNAGETDVWHFGLHINPTEKNKSSLWLNFDLGCEKGTKSLHIFGSPDESIDDDIGKLAKEGKNIGELVNSFYFPTKKSV